MFHSKLRWEAVDGMNETHYGRIDRGDLFEATNPGGMLTPDGPRGFILVKVTDKHGTPIFRRDWFPEPGSNWPPVDLDGWHTGWAAGLTDEERDAELAKHPKGWGLPKDHPHYNHP